MIIHRKPSVSSLLSKDILVDLIYSLLKINNYVVYCVYVYKIVYRCCHFQSSDISLFTLKDTLKNLLG